ncbi:hypothetical protein HanRHA438_Chr03g0134241 [Helianthus annuus]|nr:hypothetical protein HanIR_Chr03g0133681 [Helianthus annuus]KAJ0936716.1 hypothetical protein HanRHA438_Chr03g0134241 [Helianthus annuus]
MPVTPLARPSLTKLLPQIKYRRGTVSGDTRFLPLEACILKTSAPSWPLVPVLAMGFSGPWPQVLLKQSGTGGLHVVPVVHEVVLSSRHGAEPQRAGV